MTILAQSCIMIFTILERKSINKFLDIVIIAVIAILCVMDTWNEIKD